MLFLHHFLHQPAPPAYVFVTNHPYEYSLNSPKYRSAVFAEGFKIPGFKGDTLFPSIRAVMDAREAHADMFALLKALAVYHRIPSTFDAQIPEFAFTSSTPRLLIGEKYRLPDNDSEEIIGELVEAVVDEDSSLVYGFYKTETGNNMLYTCPLTADELAAYRKFPDTFFGVDRPPSKKLHSRIELFDWFFERYRDCSKDRLLKLLKDAPDFEQLKDQGQKDLAITYCERLTYSLPLK